MTAILAVAVQLSAQPARIQAQAPRALFSDARDDRSAAPAPASTDSEFLRSRVATVNLSMLTAAGPVSAGFVPAPPAARTIDLNLFSDVNLVAQLDHVEMVSTLGYAWVGTVAGVEGSQVVLAIADGRLSATINLPAHQYTVGRSAEAQAYTIAEIDRTVVKPGAPPLTPRPGSVPRVDAGAAAGGNDAGDTFDLLLYFTTTARNAAGGTAAMSALITTAIAQANFTYLQSGITSRLRLVAALETNVTESGDISKDLSAFAANADVKAARDRYGADLVTLTVSADPQWSGVAYVMSRLDPAFASSAYSAVTAKGMFYSLAHELAHNMGCDHEPGNTLGGSGHGVFPYSQGYTDFTHRFFDVMSYGLGCSSGTDYCFGIYQFSSPLNTYKGYPVGTDTQDAARSIMETRTTVANFRQSVTQPPGAPTNLTASGSGSTVRLSWTAPATGTPTSYVIAAANEPDPRGIRTVVDTQSVATSFTASGVPAGTYYIRVLATDGVTLSPPSNVVSLLLGKCSRSPAPPRSLTVESVAGSAVSLTWSGSYGNDYETTFILEAGSRPAVTDLASVDLASPLWSAGVPNVPAGSYYVRVRGKNACGVSAPSNEVLVVVR